MQAGSSARQRSGQGGFVMMTMLMVIAAAVLAVVVGLATIDKRTGLAVQVATFTDDRSFDAAVNGLEDAIFVANSSTSLTGGVSTTRSLTDGRAFTYTTTLLGSDGVDNDGDGSTDEADEDKLRVQSTGTCDGTSTVLQMDLAAVTSGSTAAPTSSMTALNGSSAFDLQGSGSLTGQNYNIDGTRGSSAYDHYGMMVESPDTVATLSSMVPSGDQSSITGLGSAPSFGVASGSTSFATIKTSVQASATTTYTSSSVNNASFGNASLGTYQVTYAAGDIWFKAGSRGAGVLYCAGNLKANGSFRFDGIIYVEGTVDLSGTATIFGAIVTGPSSSSTTLGGSAQLRYSETAVNSSSPLVGGGGSKRYTGFTGWSDLTP